MATTSVIAGPTIPVADSQADKVVELVKSDGPPGLQADRVFLGPDYANYVVSTGNVGVVVDHGIVVVGLGVGGAVRCASRRGLVESVGT